MLTLSLVADRINLPLRRLQYVCDHGVVPGVASKGRGFGVTRTFTDVEACDVALAAYLLQVGLARRIVAAALIVVIPQPRGRRRQDSVLHQAWLAPSARLEIGDDYVVRIQASATLDTLDTGWLPLWPKGFRVVRQTPIVTVSVNLELIAGKVRRTDNPI